MGSTIRPDEMPVREVEVGPFAVAIIPVSNQQFGEFLAATGHEPPRFWDDPRFNAPGQPVVGVSWFDATAYCAWLSELLGRACRLPTEAEREFAARGGREGVVFPWGDTAWTDGPFALGAQGTDRPLAIGSTPPNGFGLYHMGENVHEWCSDWYDPAGYAGLPAVNPRGVDAGVRRASRGGSWRHHVKVSRIAARSSLAPDQRYNDYGMRVYADPR
jgi:formylglycine-generating enzyme required for sulfatase activity